MNRRCRQSITNNSVHEKAEFWRHLKVDDHSSGKVVAATDVSYSFISFSSFFFFSVMGSFGVVRVTKSHWK